jgi:hypothetical protein
MGVRHKKTRKEKVIADYRHQVYILKNNSALFNNPTPAIVVDEKSYTRTYVLKDILKTGILTCSIIAAQIALFILLKRHIFSIPNLSY